LDANVRRFFERYEAFFNQSLGGDFNEVEASALYSSEFIAASPAGVIAGKNDDQLKEGMKQGYARYRSMGTKGVRIREIRVSTIDQLHCVAHVAWTANYARDDQPDAVVDFDVHYFLQTINHEPKVFGWVSGDEEALLREHGVIKSSATGASSG
jgi:hypothetical protein